MPDNCNSLQVGRRLPKRTNNRRRAGRPPSYGRRQRPSRARGRSKQDRPAKGITVAMALGRPPQDHSHKPDHIFRNKSERMAPAGQPALTRRQDAALFRKLQRPVGLPGRQVGPQLCSTSTAGRRPAPARAAARPSSPTAAAGAPGRAGDRARPPAARSQITAPARCRCPPAQSPSSPRASHTGKSSGRYPVPAGRRPARA